MRPLRSPLWAAERLYQLRDALLYGRHQAGWPGVHALRWQATIRALGPWVHRFPEHLGTVYRECVLSLCGSAANHASTHRQARAMLERFVDTLDWRSPRATFDQLSRGIFFAARLRQPDACLRLNRLRVAATDELPDDTKIAALQGLGESALNVQPPHAHEALDAVEAALRLQEEKARPHQNAHQLASLWHLKAQAHEALGQVDAARPAWMHVINLMRLGSWTFGHLNDTFLHRLWDYAEFLERHDAPEAVLPPLAEALELATEVAEPTQSRTTEWLIIARSRFGSALARAGLPKRARAMSESAIETTRRAPPSAWQTTTLAHLLHNFGLDLEAEGDTRGATARIEEAMAVYRQQLTIRPVLGLRDLIDAMGDLTRLLTDDPARALAVRTEQIKLQTQHLQTPAARLDLCRLLLTLSAEAFAADQDGHAPLKRALGVLDGIPRDEDGWASVRIEAGLRQAMAYRDAHRLDEATEAAIEALDLTDHTSVWRGFAARLLGELHMQADRPALAVPHLRPLWPSPAPLPTPAPGA